MVQKYPHGQANLSGAGTQNKNTDILLSTKVVPEAFGGQRLPRLMPVPVPGRGPVMEKADASHDEID